MTVVEFSRVGKASFRCHFLLTMWTIQLTIRTCRRSICLILYVFSWASTLQCGAITIPRRRLNPIRDCTTQKSTTVATEPGPAGDDIWCEHSTGAARKASTKCSQPAAASSSEIRATGAAGRTGREPQPIPIIQAPERGCHGGLCAFAAGDHGAGTSGGAGDQRSGELVHRDFVTVLARIAAFARQIPAQRADCAAGEALQERPTLRDRQRATDHSVHAGLDQGTTDAG